MTVRDPAQLLQRIPELEALTGDARIARAIESGDVFKVYRALVWARLLRRLPEHAALLKSLAGQRRLFAKPLKGSPGLGSINSVGFSFVGSAERDAASNTYVALHAFVILFQLPVIPLGAYIVQSAGSKGLSSQWRIFARVPLGWPSWLYQRGIAAGLVCLVGAGAINAFHQSRFQDLTVWNGFDVPLTVKFGEHTASVPKQGHFSLELPVGKIDGQAMTADGRVVDRQQETLTSSGNEVVWNIAGATPLVLEYVHYVKEGSNATPEKRPEEVFCGQNFHRFSSVNDIYTDPPKTVSMGKHEDTVTRSHLFALSQGERHGSSLCLSYLLQKDALEASLPILEERARQSGWALGDAYGYVRLAEMVSAEKTIPIARMARDAHPDEVDLQRAYQHVQIDAGHLQQMQEEYSQRAQREPESAQAQYLAAVLMPGHAGLMQMEKLSARFADDPVILRSTCFLREAHGDFAGASKAWQALKALSPQDAERILDTQVSSLLATHRIDEAWQVLDEAFRAEGSTKSNRYAASLALIANGAGKDPESAFAELRKKADAGDLDFDRVRGGLEPELKAKDQPPEVKLALALRDHPDFALQWLDKASRPDLVDLGREQWALLYGEALRRKADAAVARLERVGTMDLPSRSIFARYVRGEAVTLDEAELSLEERAAAYFIRSRNDTLPVAEREKLRAQAAKSDVLHSVISTAIKNWAA